MCVHRQYKDAPTEAIRRVLEQHLGTPIPRGTPVPTAHIDVIRMGTTVATNALLEREGAKTALLITEGFRDLLHIGNQSRPDIFDLTAAAPSVLYSAVLEVPERLVLHKVPLGPNAAVQQDAPAAPSAVMELYAAAPVPVATGGGGAAQWCCAVPSHATVAAVLRTVQPAHFQALLPDKQCHVPGAVAAAAGYACLVSGARPSWRAAVAAAAAEGGQRLLAALTTGAGGNAADPATCLKIMDKLPAGPKGLVAWWQGSTAPAHTALAALLLHASAHCGVPVAMPSPEAMQDADSAVARAAAERGLLQQPVAGPLAVGGGAGAGAAGADSGPPQDGDVVVGVTGEALVVRRALDASRMRPALEALVAQGFTSAAIVLLHSYAWDGHEVALAQVAKEAGFTQVSTSSGVMRMVKAVPRGYTTCADAYLTPHIAKYVSGFQSGFDAGMASGRVRVQFMQSDGGLTPVSGFSGHRAVLSGPAGGVVGYAMTTARVLGDVAASGVALPTTGDAVVGYDMGGTSTDVSRYAGAYEHVFECVTAGVTIQAPQLDISTVAAGGGSRLFFHEGMFVVGPQSAGAHPGPVCYRKGGYLAVTDANVQLGRVVPAHFPAIFGPGEDQPLDVQGTAEAFQALRGDMLQWREEQGGEDAAAVGSIDEIAYGFVQVANEAMCRPIRELTQMKGHDLSKHTLACFGGAGGQHACAMARALGMRCVVVHRYSGILSAYGLALADVVQEAQEPMGSPLGRQDAQSHDAIAAAVASGADGAAAPGGIATAAAAAVADAAARLLRLAQTAAAALGEQGFDEGVQHVQPFVNLRFNGTDTALMVPAVPAGSQETAGLALSIPLPALAEEGAALQLLRAGVQSAVTHFVLMYKREYGFTFPGAAIVVDDVRVRVTALSPAAEDAAAGAATGAAGSTSDLPEPLATRSVYFEGGRVPTPFFALGCLQRGHAVVGPAVLVDATSTLVVEPHCTAHVGQGGDVAIVLHAAGGDASGPAAAVPAGGAQEDEDVPCDPIQLGVFSHRFMSIAEQMGRTLQRTSISVNIKERLDFSCALFSGCMPGAGGGVDIAASGTLVSNAPHIPVHLGAMSAAVRYQLQHYMGAGTGGLAPGDVLVSNHPQLAGGSHLPDMTVITPVFLRDDAGGIGDAAPAEGGQNNPIVFFVASRGHHSDIGGIAPGSMPPTSSSLAEEGAAIVTCKLVRQGHFQEADIVRLLQAPGKLGIPGCVGTRNVPDVLSDLRAQIAANERGVHLIRALCATEGLHVVHSYMRHIQANAEHSVRSMLKAHAAKVARAQGRAISAAQPTVQLAARDFMDDGSVIALQLTLDGVTGAAHFDFGGTSSEVLGNTNAPPAVTSSAVIYALRCLVGRDIPLNEGCLAPVRISIPPGSLLNPSPAAGVVGGNVLTSQRVTDVVFQAFQAAAASQGCMNNLTFGDDSMGFYETICGGSGAGPSWSGRSGVHTHMTNTRITDPEIIEKRYPIVLRAFFLRAGSGGAGARRGGDGVIRALEFRKPLQCSILSERRAFAPWGLAGGGPGARGINLLFKSNAPPGGSGARSELPASVVMGVQVAEAGGAGGRVLNVGGKRTFQVGPGDVFVVATPGGGGFGPAVEGAEADGDDGAAKPSALGGGSWGALKAEQASF